jgi:hypothetical protein
MSDAGSQVQLQLLSLRISFATPHTHLRLMTETNGDEVSLGFPDQSSNKK